MRAEGKRSCVTESDFFGVKKYGRCTCFSHLNKAKILLGFSTFLLALRHATLFDVYLNDIVF